MQEFIVGMIFLSVFLLFVGGMALIFFQEYFSSKHAETITELEKELESANKRIITLEDSLAICNSQFISKCPVVTTEKGGKN